MSFVVCIGQQSRIRWLESCFISWPGTTAWQVTPRMAEPNGDGREGQHEPSWEEMEHTYLEMARKKREKEDREAAEKHRASILAERETLLALFTEREPIINELSRIDGQVRSVNNRITWKENEYKQVRNELRAKREREDAAAAAFIREGRLARQRGLLGPWPVKNGRPPAPQYGPHRYHQQPQPQHQHQHERQPQAQPYTDSRGTVYPQQLPRSPVRSPGVDGMATQRQAETALAALNNGQVPGGSDEQRMNGRASSPKHDTPAAVGAAQSDAQGVNGNAAAKEPQDLARSDHGAANPTPVATEAAIPGQAPSAATPSQAPSAAAPGQAPSAATADAPEDAEMPDADEKIGVEVYDAEGKLIGEVKRIEERNPWIKAALQFPIVRKVEVRAGRKFGPEDLDKIYEPTDTKGTKWLSCVIQASGFVQGQECTTCAKNTGVFSECVIVPGDQRFPRCANCEWGRQACTGASLIARPKSATGAPPDAATETVPPRRSLSRKADSVPEQPQPSGGFTAVNSSATAAKKEPSIQQSIEEDPNERADGQLRRKERKSLPGGRAFHQDAATGDETPQKKARGSRKSLPEGPSGKDGADNDEAEADEDDDTEEITRDMLVFQDDGRVFTEPEIMRGVPLEKIDEDHPYWEESWPASLEDFIMPHLEKWQEKYEKALVESATQSSKYLANRQVNRGKAVLQYIQDGPIHPFQIVSKRYVTKKLFNYDTIHRLVQILDELKKFKIEVSPTEWVRHRLHQKFLEKGDKFALDEEVEALYHDSKVRYIRKKSGYGNIGRPSGYRMKGEVNATPRKMPRGTKRKKGGSASPDTPAPQVEPGPQPENKTPSLQAEKEAMPSPPDPSATAPPPPEPPADPRPTSSRGRHLTRPPTADGPPAASPAPSSSTSTRRASKKPKTSHPPDPSSSSSSSTTTAPPPPAAAAAEAVAAAANDLSFDGYTTTDSFSSDPIYHHDWRIYQVKTARISSNPRVTQYYHWVDGAGAGSQEASFEHQVLKDVIPSRNKVTWGVYRQP